MSNNILALAKRPDVKKEAKASQTRKAEYSPPISSPVERILFLQRVIGNQAVARLIKATALQPELRIGKPNDIYEQEADKIAERVMQMLEPTVPKKTSAYEQIPKMSIYRECSEYEKELHKQPLEKNDELQTKTSSDQTPELNREQEAGINALRNGGQPLPESARAFFEPRFGCDFGNVRVHTGMKAAEAAQAVNAMAFTVGPDIVFGEGRFEPSTDVGRRLIAHELAHVVQQRSSKAFHETGDNLNLPAIPRFSQSPVLMLKSDDSTLPVPQWSDLPDYVKADLTPQGYGKTWFDSHGDAIRLTVLIMYVKLKGMDLWRFVGTESSTGQGTLEFLSSDVNALKNTLRSRDDFTSPEESSDEWSSREMRATGQLHFKHFKGWPEAKIQAHIDQHGLLLRSKWWWLTIVVPIGQMALHGMTYDSYGDVFGIRDILLDQGWDPAPLRGVAALQRKELSVEQPNAEDSQATAHLSVDEFRKSSASKAWPQLDR